LAAAVSGHSRSIPHNAVVTADIPLSWATTRNADGIGYPAWAQQPRFQLQLLLLEFLVAQKAAFQKSLVPLKLGFGMSRPAGCRRLAHALLEKTLV
jgi:hypothetical protein